MLNVIIRFSVRNKLIVGLFILTLLIWGAIDVKKLPIDALPDITSNQVQIITVSPSLAAPEIERLITFPLEQATANIPDIQEMRSISRFGLSVITIVFEDDTDVYWARQQVSERLITAREQIPAEAGMPELAPATTGIGEIYQYVLRPAKGYEGKYDLTTLRSVQDWIVRRQLLGTPGVADVSSFGGYVKQYEVAIIPARLKSMNVTIADVFNALENNNQNSGGAYIEKGPAALFIRTEGLATAIEDVKKIVVRYTKNGIPITVNDVAEVRLGHAIRYGAMTYKDKGEVAGAVVLMLKGANASQVIENVKEKIEQIKKTLPEGIVLEPFYDRTKMVERAIGTVKKNLAEGALIVVFVLVLFLGNLRAGLIVASVIPLAMLFAVILMNVFGVTGNLMSLGALDFGLIVDGAVIIVEAVLHRIQQSKYFSGFNTITASQMDEEVEKSAGRMMNAAVFGQVIILIVYLPILTLTGIEGKMFRPMAQTVSFALIGAFLLSLTYVPMMSSWLLSKKLSHKTSFADRMMNFLQNKYRLFLQKAIEFPKIVVGTSLLLFVLAVFIINRLGGEFIPEMEEGDFAVDARLLTGSSLTETIKTTQQAVSVLQSNFPEVEKIVTRIGASEIPTDPMPLEMTDIMISLKPKDEWTSASSFDELADKMSRSLSVVPGMTSGFQFPVQMRFNELISGARQDVVCKIFGDDLDSLAHLAGQIGKVVSTVNGAADIYVETVTGLPQIVVSYNREALAHYQLSINDVNRIIRMAFAGESAGIIYESEQRYDLVVRLKDDIRKDITDIQNLPLATPDGLQIPLYLVANVSIKEGPNQIQRENAQRRIMVGFNVRGRDVESVVEELSTNIGENIRFPSGYYIKYGGQFENLTEAKQRLSIAVPAALLLIFIMLYLAFGSVKYGILIFSAIPLSSIGGVLALWLRGMPFSISAGVGFIALFGVAVLNGIVLISEFNRIKKSGSMDVKKIIMEGTGNRLRPVLMTASVASLGFLPMALSQGAGAEVQRPLATVVIGGLITATLLTLVVLPVLYEWVEKNTGRQKSSRAAVIGIICFFLSLPVYSQKTATLDEVLQLAAERNTSIKSLKKETEYWKQLQLSVFDPGKTQLGVEYGSINSMNTDSRLFINQSFNLPVVYKRQKNYYKTSAQLQEEMVKWKQLELTREIKLLFYQIVDGMERKKILLRLDSVYSKFQRAAYLRYKSGETNLLEKVTAESQIQQMKLQQQDLDADIRMLQYNLQWLLATSDEILPAYSSVTIDNNIVADTSGLQQHPQIKYFLLQENKMAAQGNVERSGLLPGFEVGYNNQSIVGWQSADGISQKYYGSGHRFHMINVSIGIPIFNGAVKSRIKAVAINNEAARINTIAAQQKLKSEQLQLLEEYRKRRLALNYYKETGLKQAELIMMNAAKSFENGELSYLEWTMLMNNAVSIQLGYLNAVKEYNKTIIQIEYLNGK